MEKTGRFTGNYAETVATLRASFPIAIPSISVLARGVAIETTHQVSIWDALLIAACVEAGVTTLFTEDIQSRSAIEGVRFVNPLE